MFRSQAKKKRLKSFLKDLSYCCRKATPIQAREIRDCDYQIFSANDGKSVGALRSLCELGVSVVEKIRSIHRGGTEDTEVCVFTSASDDRGIYC
jgi:hypothetical protein